MFSLAEVSGITKLLLGNEAIARGAIEAGVKVVASYPGTPASEILESLAKVSEEAGIYVEWSVNEKVAAEVAAGASFAGLRAMVAFKHEGLNVSLDLLSHLNLAGIRGGLVVVVGDDPSGWSSPSENDSRPIIQWLNVPLFEPSTPQEAKDMARWAFELSEEIGVFCVIRSCTRVSHATGNTLLGEVATDGGKPVRFNTSEPFTFVPIVRKHTELLAKLYRARERFEASPFNYYEGPKRPELLIVSSGSGRLHVMEALNSLKLEERVGILHLGTTWPLPITIIEKCLSSVSNILVVEEVDPFLERNFKAFAYDIGLNNRDHSIYGKGSGHIPAYGELTPDIVIDALLRLMGLTYEPRDRGYERETKQVVQSKVIPREVVWCPGCPHRASFWTIKNVLRLDGRDGLVSGDIGCYGLDRRGAGGYLVTKVALAMGAGAGVGCGLGQLGRFGFNQPVITVCGDSTFFHSAIPALINAKYNRANLIMMILDNNTTAMTGFHPHPGIGLNAVGDKAPVTDIEALCRGLNIPVEVMDPFDIKENTERLLELIREGGGVKAVIMRRPCALLRPVTEKPKFKVWVDTSKCRGDECGCDRYCVRIFKCPGIVWDKVRGKAQIDEAVCVGCGVCSSICPAFAIIKDLRGE